MQDNKTKNTGTNPKGDRMRKAGATLIAVAVVFGAGELAAQSATETANASINIPTVIAIGVNGTDIDFGAVLVSAYDETTGTGYATTASQSVITTRSNMVHDLTIHTSDEFMNGPADDTKPVSHLEWDIDGAGSWTPMSTSTENILTSIARGAGERATISYRMFLDLATDEPGDHNLQFTFTAIAP